MAHGAALEVTCNTTEAVAQLLITNGVLLFLGVAQPYRQTQRIGQVIGALGEQRPRIGLLIECMVSCYLISCIDSISWNTIQWTVCCQRCEQILRHERSVGGITGESQCEEGREKAVEVSINHHLALHIELILIDITT